MKKFRVLNSFFLLFFLQGAAFAAENPPAPLSFPPAVGEAFGQPVLKDETPIDVNDKPVTVQKILKMTVKRWPTSLPFKK